MPLPTGEPTTADKVKAWSTLDDITDDDVVALAEIVAAVNDLVRGLPVAQRLDVEPAPGEWPPMVSLGATMLAARIYRRRATPGGVEAAGGFGVAYVRRVDPDVAQMLELGEYAPPAVG